MKFLSLTNVKWRKILMFHKVYHFWMVQDNWMTFSLYIRVILIQHYPTSSTLPAFDISSLCFMMIYLCFQVPRIARHPSWRLLYLVIPAILDLNIITSRSSTSVLPQFHNSLTSSLHLCTPLPSLECHTDYESIRLLKIEAAFPSVITQSVENQSHEIARSFSPVVWAKSKSAKVSMEI